MKQITEIWRTKVFQNMFSLALRYWTNVSSSAALYSFSMFKSISLQQTVRVNLALSEEHDCKASEFPLQTSISGAKRGIVEKRLLPTVRHNPSGCTNESFAGLVTSKNDRLLQFCSWHQDQFICASVWLFSRFNDFNCGWRQHKELEWTSYSRLRIDSKQVSCDLGCRFQDLSLQDEEWPLIWRQDYSYCPCICLCYFLVIVVVQSAAETTLNDLFSGFRQL